MSFQILPNLTSSWPGSRSRLPAAVDDMYLGCGGAMAAMVRSMFFPRENTGRFGEAWQGAAGCANSKVTDPEDRALTRDHLQAICVYTSGRGKFHATFNAAVQKPVKNYRNGFPYHSVHFWLTSAVQILSQSKRCQQTFRRTNQRFSARVGDVMSFGFFASSSLDPKLKRFGTKTCFKIRTCSGGFLKHYPTLGYLEQEVLVPPYEMFRVTGKEKGGGDLCDCEVVYLLQSAGVHSSFNCRAVNS